MYKGRFAGNNVAFLLTGRCMNAPPTPHPLQLPNPCSQLDFNVNMWEGQLHWTETRAVTSEFCQLSLQGDGGRAEGKGQAKQHKCGTSSISQKQISYQKVLVIDAKPLSEVPKHQRAVLLEFEMTRHVLPVDPQSWEITKSSLRVAE